MIHPRVAIIILNWNGWGDTLECLESVYQITYPNYDVIVVDNGSEDESVEKIREYCGGEIEVESKFFEYSSENKPIKIIGYTREEAEAGGGEEGGIDDLPSNEKLMIIKNEKNYGFVGGW
ncbi:MAG: Glycosyl transferase family 2 [Candidatus Argoarchaeum ethanivorans]|uniref:Glycosyl transferase family 2 n=1 Tax=Candidatus Argoarchaeum ethanivorans TaxID=2608793 RepID=A0A811T634_9EURY|nr:MAG: Glycosyl transferase family 2 [Candidatus Argoarchaeum ethanivorans]